VVCIGDDRQLPEVDAGGLFHALSQRLPVITLTENRRQRDPVEQSALLDLRSGRVDAAVGRLERNGNITMADNADVLRSTLVTDWHNSSLAGNHAVMTASNRADVADLNERARELLVDEGALGPVVATVGATEFRIGDRVIAHRNRYDLGVLNGDTGTVTSANRTHVHITLDEDRQLRLPVSYVADGLLTHAYATTVHKAQGMTCDEMFTLGDDGLYNELGYTALSRGRERNRLYVVAGAWDQTPGASIDPLAHVRSALTTSRAQTAAIDIANQPNPIAHAHSRSL
jgi:ATP-dependent exoDNAse (exonuclease V) alpha subunit